MAREQTDLPSNPMVSCIMPTRNRRHFVPQALRYFLHQDYVHRELLIADDGEEGVEDLIPQDERIRYIRLEQPLSLGAKRNLACEQAKGAVIVHWDDDDWMAPWRVSYQLEQLQLANVDICGLDKLFYFDPWSRQAWETVYPRQPSSLLAGGSLCYRKQVWRDEPFPETNIGEDTAFILAHKNKSLLALENNRFYAALNHCHNTNPRSTHKPNWRSRPYQQVLALLDEDQSFYSALVERQNLQHVAVNVTEQAAVVVSEIKRNRPLVSCIMATRDRPAFVSQAIGYFLAQDYANKELLIVDDGKHSVQDRVPDDGTIRYIRLDSPLSLGQKHNLAVQESRGGIIAHWDDDDWYATNRIERQLETLLEADAQICGLTASVIYDAVQDRFWRISTALHEQMYFANVHGRSIMYRREVWEKYARFPDRSLGEDALFLKNALNKGASLVRLENEALLIYIRHGQNTWEFPCGRFIRPEAWQSIAAPETLPADALAFYQRYRQTQITPAPLANGIPATTQLSPQERLSDCHVTVSIPYHGCADTLRRAVASILGQTHRALILVVINDGDTPPWDVLDDIDDPRLVRFDLPGNHGRYFADAVVLNASQSPYFLVQDADDWSEPDRIAGLLHQLRLEHAQGAISAQQVHHMEPRQRAPGTEHYRALSERLDATLRHRANHHGLYRTEALRRIGGYYGGFRMGYDTLLVNLLQMTGRLTYVEKPYYHRFMRPDSLSNAAATGMQSRSRQAIIPLLNNLYADAFRAYQGYLGGELSYARLCRAIRALCQQHVPPQQQQALQVETARLQQTLQGHDLPAAEVTTVVGALIDDPRIPWSDWSLDKAFAGQMMACLEARPPERILEVGAGASTFLLAELAARTGAVFVSLEHDESYYRTIKSLLAELGLLQYVDLRLAPLAPYRCANGQDYPWYQTEFSGKFDFVLLDGPPERHGREAGLFALQSCLADNWSIWLHDGNRSHEHACIALWRAHYSFISTLSQADPKGVFCLNSPQSTAALVPQTHNTACAMGIALLTGDRPALLRRTVESFRAHSLEILQTSTVVALVNGRDHEAEHYLQQCAFVDCVLSYPHEVLPIGTAAGYLAATLAGCKGVESILHLEDDWLSRADHPGWLQQAEDILQAYPDIGQIRLRHQGESVLSANMATQEPIRWVQDKDFRFSPEAHFTFNPNLIRAADVDKIYPSRTEYEAQLKFQDAGFCGAQLLPGCFQHIGTRQSRRIRLEHGAACAGLNVARMK